MNGTNHVTLAPFTTWPVQNEALRALYERLQDNEVPHALLLVGGSAQTAALAKFLAQLLLCQGDAAPCGTCPACVQFMAGSHPDYHWVDGSDGSIKTAEIEELQVALQLRSHFGHRIVYVMTDIDNATAVAANRLLKTLEEPQPGIVAVLTTAHVRRVLPTILSRCQPIRLSSVDVEPWEDPVGMLQPDGDSSEQSGFAADLDAVIQWTEMLLRTEEPGLALAEALLRIAAQREGSLSDILTLCSLWLRDVLHTRTGNSTYIRFQTRQADLARHAECAEVAELAKCIDLVVLAKVRLQSHVAANLNIEQLCIRLREVLHEIHSGRRPVQDGR
ncbi:MAG: DNA polymerase III subunit [Alicyclobacillus sp.]|nr:DNA polymerase III subunit [Alicyclobacillus sp.]